MRFAILAGTVLAAALSVATTAGAAPTGSDPDPDVQCFQSKNGDWNCHDVGDLADECKFTDPDGESEECKWVNSQTKKIQPGWKVFKGPRQLTTRNARPRAKAFAPPRKQRAKIRTLSRSRGRIR